MNSSSDSKTSGSRDFQTMGVLSDTDRQRIIARMVKDYGFAQQYAEQVFDEILLFLRLTTISRQGFVPSPEVDKGWHTFILYTKTYTAFCRSLGFGYIHHEPDDGPEAQEEGGYAETIQFMDGQQIQYNSALWPKPES